MTNTEKANNCERWTNDSTDQKERGLMMIEVIQTGNEGSLRIASAVSKVYTLAMQICRQWRVIGFNTEEDFMQVWGKKRKAWSSVLM